MGCWKCNGQSGLKRRWGRGEGKEWKMKVPEGNQRKGGIGGEGRGRDVGEGIHIEWGVLRHV